MKISRRFRIPVLAGRLPIPVALVLLLLHASTVLTQDVTEVSLKAAFIYRVAQFTTWPPELLTGTAPFSACVVGDGVISDVLTKAVKGRAIWGHGVNVSHVPPEGPLRSCHLLYVSGVSATQVAAVLAAVRGAPVLTISDIDDFDQIGGIAHLFIDNGKIRFDLNLELARRSRLELSSKLLTLAAHVRDEQAGRR
jgi:YfiR/HmsC-like